MKILVCDDENDILQIVSLALQKEYTVVTRNHVSDPIALLDEVQPDILLMDVWIPDIGGEETVKILRQSEKYKDLPIYMFSANNEIEKIATRVKASGYISKPFSLSDLKKLVATAHQTRV